MPKATKKAGFSLQPAAPVVEAGSTEHVEEIDPVPEDVVVQAIKSVDPVDPVPPAQPSINITDLVAALRVNQGGSPDLQAALAKIDLLQKQLADAQAKKASVEDDPTAANSSRASTKKRIRIILDEGMGQHDLRTVPVGVNGRTYQIRRGVEVDVPPEVVEVLKHAIETKTIPMVDENTGFTKGSYQRDVRRFPYQVQGVAVDETGKRLMPEIEYA